MSLLKDNIVFIRDKQSALIAEIMSMPVYLPVAGNVLLPPCRAYSDGFFAGVALIVTGVNFFLGTPDSPYKYQPYTSEFTAFMWGLEQGKLRARNFNA